MSDQNHMIDLSQSEFNCVFHHEIDTQNRLETFKLSLNPKDQSKQSLLMQVQRPMMLYKYLNQSLEQIDHYPSEFSVLRHFCQSMIVKKSVIEDF